MHCKSWKAALRRFVFHREKSIIRLRDCGCDVFLFLRSCPENVVTIYPADVVLFEGILVFYFQSIRELFHMKLFVDTDSDTRLARRVPRDIKERGRDLDQVLTQYMTFVKPAFDEFCSPVCDGSMRACVCVCVSISTYV